MADELAPDPFLPPGDIPIGGTFRIVFDSFLRSLEDVETGDSSRILFDIFHSGVPWGLGLPLALPFAAVEFMPTRSCDQEHGKPRKTSHGALALPLSLIQ